MKMSQRKQVLKVLLDFLILVCFGIALLAVKLWVEPYHRGYFADDDSLKLPFKEQSISEALLAAVGLILNAVTIIAIEVARDRRGKSIGDQYLVGNLVPGWLWESYVAIGIFVFGAACEQMTVSMTKNVIGRLRPHFFDLYIQVKGKWRGSKLLRHGVQYAALMGAWYVGLSRVVEHMHHWSDVLVGFIIGSSYAVLTFIFVLKPKKYSSTTASWQNTLPESNALPRPVLAR